jgi:hypothetical protein
LLLKGDGPEDDVIVGTVSWGRGCANNYYPTVFSSMSFSYHWLLLEACRLSPDDLPESFACRDINGSGERIATTTSSPSVSLAPSPVPSSSPSLEPSPAPSSSPSSEPDSNAADGVNNSAVDNVDFISWSTSEPLQHCLGDCK